MRYGRLKPQQARLPETYIAQSSFPAKLGCIIISEHRNFVPSYNLDTMGHGPALRACICSNTNLRLLAHILVNFHFQIYRIHGTSPMVRARVVADAQAAEEGLNAGWLGGPPQVPLEAPQVVAGSNLVHHSLMMVLGSVRPKQAQLAAQAASQATWTQVFASSASCATLRALEALGAQACIRLCCHHCWLRHQQLRLEAIELFDAGPATAVANSIERLLRSPLPECCTWLGKLFRMFAEPASLTSFLA
jgi:hypothetical protein